MTDDPVEKAFEQALLIQSQTLRDSHEAAIRMANQELELPDGVGVMVAQHGNAYLVGPNEAVPLGHIGVCDYQMN